MSESPFGSLIEDALKNNYASVEEKEGSINVVGQANIKVVGVGGGGSNAVNWLYKKGISGAGIIAINTDKAHLEMVEADTKILIGKSLTKGLGCGGFPCVGRESAKEQLADIRNALKGSDMVFITAGMGGGTGTGAAPIVAAVAKENKAIVIAAVTMPFSIEKARIDKAEYGLDELRNVCDTVIIIDNNKLVKIAGNLPIQQAFAVANELISTMIKGIVEIIAVPSLVNLDYADVKAIMADGDVSVVGIGESDSANRVEEAVKRALSNQLLDVSYEGATGALIHITGGPDLTLDEVNKAGQLLTENLDPDANVIWGSRIDPTLKGKIRVMAIITGVTSPQILGKKKSLDKIHQKRFSDLGVDYI
ncbi:MAG: cell division protein FtsZ [Candidatus Woesearchaeota archaeon]